MHLEYILHITHNDMEFFEQTSQIHSYVSVVNTQERSIVPVPRLWDNGSTKQIW